MGDIKELQGEVARLQSIGLHFADVKTQIAGVVACQKATREALTAAKDTVGGPGAPCWVLRPGGVWLQLPADQAQRVLRTEGQELGGRLEGLFLEQKQVLAQMEEEGLGPEHFTLITSISNSSSSGGSSGSSSGS